MIPASFNVISLAVFVCLFVIVLLLFYLYFAPSTSRSTTVPGPNVINSWEGNLPDIAKAPSFTQYVLELHQQYGPIVSFYLGPQLLISTASPELFKEQVDLFDRPVELFECFVPFITVDSLQLANGQDGRSRRLLYDQAFAHNVVVQSYVHIFNECGSELCAKVASTPLEGHVAVKEVVFASVLRSVLMAVFGDNCRLSETANFLEHYEFIWEQLEREVSGQKAPVGEEKARLDESIELVHNFVRKALRKRRERPPADGQQLFIDILLENALPDAQIEADAITMLTGAVHTTSYLLTWAIYYLCKYPDYQERLYKEVVATLGNRPGDVTIETDHVASMKYMRQVLDETLRCSQLAPMAARVNMEKDMRLGGHVIAKGTPVIQLMGAWFADPQAFTQPDRFDPDRFSKENAAKLPRFGFEPFGFAGKRKCPGYRFFYVEAAIFLGQLLRRVRMQLADDDYVPTKQYGLVTRPTDEIYITVQSRL